MIKKIYKNAKILKRFHAYKGYVITYNFETLNSFNPELQLRGAVSTVRNKLKDFLTELKGFNFVIVLFLEFTKREIDDKTKFSTYYLSPKTGMIIDEGDADDLFGSIYTKIISNIQ